MDIREITSFAPILLIGGFMTLDDGSVVDSRQAMTDDDESILALRALQHSRSWWETSFSVARAINTSQNDYSFTLLCGPRTIFQTISEGGVKKVRLQSIVGEKIDKLDICRSRSYTADDPTLPESHPEVLAKYVDRNKYNLHSDVYEYRIGMNRGDPRIRWKYLEGYYPFYDEDGSLSAHINPVVTINAEGIVAQTLAEFHAVRENRASVIILPHTHAIEQFLSKYLDWLKGDSDTQRYFGEPFSEEWDPLTPHDPKKYINPVVLSSDFAITASIVGMEWSELGHEEEARQLIESRFDLSLGFWDLVNNDILRDALLKEATPIEKKTEIIQTPSAIQQRAADKAKSRDDIRILRDRFDKEIEGVMEDPLWQIEWYGSNRFWKPLAYLMNKDGSPKRNSEGEIVGYVNVFLNFGKHSHTISLLLDRYIANEVYLYAHIQRVLPELLKLTAYEPEFEHHKTCSLYKGEGGWGDSLDWSKLIPELEEMVNLIKRILKDLIRDCKAHNQDVIKFRSEQN